MMLFVWHMSDPLVCSLQMQAWFLVDDGENGDRARNFLKTIMLKTGDNVLFAGTGNSMASVWSNIAAMAPNGISLLTHVYRVHLPAAVSADAAKESWRFLQSQCPAVPAQLAGYISNSVPAMQVYLCQQYLSSPHPRPSTSAELLRFVREFEINKLQMEV